MYGYYFFLGRGDWGTSRDKSLDPTFGGNVPTRLLGDWGPHRRGTDLKGVPEWTASWDATTWKKRIDFLVDHLGVDTLALCLNGLLRAEGGGADRRRHGRRGGGHPLLRRRRLA